MTVILLASIFPVDLFPSSPRAVQGIDGQLSGRQGEVLLVKITAQDGDREVSGKFLGRTFPFFEDQGGNGREYVGLLGIDMQDVPGMHELAVSIGGADGIRRLSYNVLVIKERFPVQNLRLPREMDEIDELTATRVKAEQERVKTVLAVVSNERQWETEFLEPVHGTVSGAFGRLRVINGHPKNPHNGEDIAAPKGTPVVATNDGVACLTVDHFFSGKGVFLDHGLGLYSMYFHLDEVLVEEGKRVARGQMIGKVGASGRATGPHLHWGVRVNGARVDPYALLRLPVKHSKPVPR